MAARWDFVIKQGESFQRCIEWKDSAGDLANLTGATAAMAARGNAGDATALFELTTGNGYLSLGGVNGTITIAIPRAVTELLNFDYAYHDLSVYLASGLTKFLLEGIITLDKRITDVEQTYEGPMPTVMMGPFRIGAGVLQSGYDYEAITMPIAVTITRVEVYSMANAITDAQIDIRNAAGGAGAGISVPITTGNNTGNNTGVLGILASGVVYARVVSGGGLQDVNVKLWMTST